jgi:hypothetical protein
VAPNIINRAIKDSVARAFLDSNDVHDEVSTSAKQRATADIASDAKGHPVLIECWK